eukprot:TRINITY_DN1984_c0_g1_i7.p1 TRINITY_DN1984_c0_g1~~TRINITY_DN1984_c0_g1_i7.p1  ORF type:complete len:164 (+),score=55.75 TRINITY_DN1984_c0_g1_i7:411-902(+)
MRKLWSSEGCTRGKISVKSMECLCNHLTNFTTGNTGKSKPSPVVESTISSKSFPVGVIAGIVVGVVVLAAISIGVAFFILKKRRGESSSSNKSFEMDDSFEIDWKMGSNVEFQDKLGQGAFGQVFSAVHNGTTLVAVKVLNKDADRSQFVREANIIKSLHHRR